jgi:hypothetical protein
LLIFLVINLIVVAFLVRSVFTLLTLLFEDASADAIHRADIPAPGPGSIDTRPQLIPKIIHQTYANESIPAHWQQAQQSCIDLHSDYEYKVGSTSLIVDMIDQMTRNAMLIDLVDVDRREGQGLYGGRIPVVCRDLRQLPAAYSTSGCHSILCPFTLWRNIHRSRQRGGWVLDIRTLCANSSQGCNRRLDPLLSYPAWLRRTIPTGISNDAMGAVPRHPFFLKVIDSLQSYDRDWQVPYITVMYSTGPLFLSVIWKDYIRWGVPEEARVRILVPDAYNKQGWSFFLDNQGSSWHGKDARAIFWVMDTSYLFFHR